MMEKAFAYFICISGILFDVLITTAGLLIRGGTEGNAFLKFLPSKSIIVFFLVATNLFIIPILLMMKTNSRFFTLGLYIMGGYRFSCGLTWF